MKEMLSVTDTSHDSWSLLSGSEPQSSVSFTTHLLSLIWPATSPSLLPIWPSCPSCRPYPSSATHQRAHRSRVPAPSRVLNAQQASKILLQLIHATHTSINSADIYYYQTNVPEGKDQVHLWLGNHLSSQTLQHPHCAKHRAHFWRYNEWYTALTLTEKHEAHRFQRVAVPTKEKRMYHQHHCSLTAVVWISVSPSKLYVETWCPMLTALGGRAFGSIRSGGRGRVERGPPSLTWGCS